MKKVTEETKQAMIEARAKGISFAGIGKILGFSTSTVQYHLDKEKKQKAINRAVKNQKPRERKDYQKKYQANRYNNDEEFKERVKKDNRENWRKKHGKK